MIYFLLLIPILVILRLFQLRFRPCLFWHKRKLGEEIFVPWSGIFSGRRIINWDLYMACGGYHECDSCFDKKFEKTHYEFGGRVGVLDRKMMIYTDNKIIIVCKKCKTQFNMTEMQKGTLAIIDPYF